MPWFREIIAIDDYVLGVLVRDIVGHDRQPAALSAYLYLYGQPRAFTLRNASNPACSRFHLYLVLPAGPKMIGFDTFTVLKLSMARSIILRVRADTTAKGLTTRFDRGCRMIFPFPS